MEFNNDHEGATQDISKEIEDRFGAMMQDMGSKSRIKGKPPRTT
jgi:hypothetical protein